MEKFTGNTYEEYKAYAMKRRNKSNICRTYDKEFIEYKQKHNDVPLLNGGIMSNQTNALHVVVVLIYLGKIIGVWDAECMKIISIMVC